MESEERRKWDSGGRSISEKLEESDQEKGR